MLDFTHETGHKKRAGIRPPHCRDQAGSCAMVIVVRAALAVSLAAMVGMGATAARADGISDNVVKIGVLTDMSGQFSHESGEGAVTAVRMAIEDFGGKVLGKPI